MAQFSSVRQSKAREQGLRAAKWRPPVGAALMLLLLFLFGGSARSDVPLLIALRPLSALALVWALLIMDRDGWAMVRIPVLVVGAFAFLSLIHLIPLPPAVWTALPDRQLIEDISRTMGQVDQWRPISVAPQATINAALSTVPILALLLWIAAAINRRHALLPVLLAVGLGSMLFGILQSAAPSSSGLYFYRFANFGSPIGFFANRNHQAVFVSCLIPGAFAFALMQSDAIRRQRGLVGALAFAFICCVLLAVLGSRAGLLTGFAALIGSLALVHHFSGGLSAYGRKAWLLAGILCVAVIGVILWSGRGEAVNRLADSTYGEESRFSLWAPITEQALANMPVGTGNGTFVEAYKVHEPDRLLQTNYLNNAHNDWLEAALTGGLPMLLLVAAVCWYVSARFLAVLRSDDRTHDAILAYVGFIWLLLLAIASVFDYPLRTPAMAGVGVVALVWISAQANSRRSKDTNPIDYGK